MKMDQWMNGGFFTGINYWGSESAINMWSDFNPASIEKDFQLLQGAGITVLRVFPLWPVFQPLHALYDGEGVREYTFGENPLPDTEAGRAGVSEEACENFRVFCRLAERYGMRLLVSLITGWMSGRTYNPPAFDGKDLLGDPAVLKWQLRFVKYFVSRFKEEKTIIGWDLGNETNCLPKQEDRRPDTFYVWASLIADAVKACDRTRPVCSGLDSSVSVERGQANLKSIGEMCDIHTTHPYNIFSTPSDPLNTMKPILDLPFQCRIGEDISGIPTFVQEFGSIGYLNCSRKTEADFYRAALLACLAHGTHGAMWWCAFDQGHFTYAPYRWNTIGSEYGFFDKELREKPLAEENRRFRKLLSLLPGGKLPEHAVNGLILVPREEDASDKELLRASYILAKQANLDMGFHYIADPIPDSPLYLIPCIRHNQGIPKIRLEELLSKVREGAVLYLCADTGLLRQIPEMTGVEIAYRERVDAEKTMRMGEEELPIRTAYFYRPESADAQILAVDEDGEGVFFRRRYGKGSVFFLTLPLETYLAGKAGAFYREDQPRYDLIYREAARAAGVRRVCDSDSPFVRLTEHWIDDHSLYVVAINYQNKRETARITVAEGYEVSVAAGGDAFPAGERRSRMEAGKAALTRRSSCFGGNIRG